MRHFEVSCKPNWNFPIILCVRVMPTALAKPHFYGIRESTTPTTFQALERFRSTFHTIDFKVCGLFFEKWKLRWSQGSPNASYLKTSNTGPS